MSEYIPDIKKCDTCKGSGIEYFLGEPDWCSECGGPGYIDSGGYADENAKEANTGFDTTPSQSQ